MNKYQTNFNKSLLYKSTHRGMRELEIILGNFAVHVWPALSVDKQELYTDFLACEDRDIWQWVTRQTACPPQWENLISIMHNFLFQIKQK